VRAPGHRVPCLAGAALRVGAPARSGRVPGAADDGAAADEDLVALQEAFLATDWAARTPVEVEVPFATTVAGVVLRGRMDAVFADPGGRFDVIDWKTGSRPSAGIAGA